MTTLAGRDKTALIVVDIQNGVLSGAYERDQVIANAAKVIATAREASVPVIWVRHSDAGLEHGSDAWKIVPELTPVLGEEMVDKNWGDAFEDTRLEAILADLNVGHIVLVGAQTDACIRSTLHGGFARGYDVTLVSDAHTTEDQTPWGAPPPHLVIAHTNLYWTYQTAPGRTAGTVKAHELKFATNP